MMIGFSDLIETMAINLDRPSRISSDFKNTESYSLFRRSQSNLKSIALIKFRRVRRSLIAIWPVRYHHQIDDEIGVAEQANSWLKRCHQKGEARMGRWPDRSHSFQDHQTLRGGLNNESKTGFRGATSWLVKIQKLA
jgi:hypothetical protein